MSKGTGGDCLEAISRIFREAAGARGILGASMARGMRLEVTSLVVWEVSVAEKVVVTWGF